MKKFLVPVDFSAVSEDVFDSAIALLRALGGQATLLYVIPAAAAAPDLPVPAPALRKARSAALALARKKLAAKLRAFHRLGLACKVRLVSGSPAATILQEARRIRADCIIMGSHGHGKMHDMLVGSTTRGVLRKAACSVLILPPVDRAYE